MRKSWNNATSPGNSTCAAQPQQTACERMGLAHAYTPPVFATVASIHHLLPSMPACTICSTSEPTCTAVHARPVAITLVLATRMPSRFQAHNCMQPTPESKGVRTILLAFSPAFFSASSFSFFSAALLDAPLAPCATRPLKPVSSSPSCGGSTARSECSPYCESDQQQSLLHALAAMSARA